MDASNDVENLPFNAVSETENNAQDFGGNSSAIASNEEVDSSLSLQPKQEKVATCEDLITDQQERIFPIDKQPSPIDMEKNRIQFDDDVTSTDTGISTSELPSELQLKDHKFPTTIIETTSEHFTGNAETVMDFAENDSISGPPGQEMHQTTQSEANTGFSLVNYASSEGESEDERDTVPSASDLTGKGLALIPSEVEDKMAENAAVAMTKNQERESERQEISIEGVSADLEHIGLGSNSSTNNMLPSKFSSDVSAMFDLENSEKKDSIITTDMELVSGDDTSKDDMSLQSDNRQHEQIISSSTSMSQEEKIENSIKENTADESADLIQNSILAPNEPATLITSSQPMEVDEAMLVYSSDQRQTGATASSITVSDSNAEECVSTNDSSAEKIIKCSFPESKKQGSYEPPAEDQMIQHDQYEMETNIDENISADKCTEEKPAIFSATEDYEAGESLPLSEEFQEEKNITSSVPDQFSADVGSPTVSLPTKILMEDMYSASSNDNQPDNTSLPNISDEGFNAAAVTASEIDISSSSHQDSAHEDFVTAPNTHQPDESLPIRTETDGMLLVKENLTGEAEKPHSDNINASLSETDRAEFSSNSEVITSPDQKGLASYRTEEDLVSEHFAEESMTTPGRFPAEGNVILEKFPSTQNIAIPSKLLADEVINYSDNNVASLTETIQITLEEKIKSPRDEVLSTPPEKIAFLEENIISHPKKNIALLPEENVTSSEENITSAPEESMEYSLEKNIPFPNENNTTFSCEENIISTPEETIASSPEERFISPSEENNVSLLEKSLTSRPEDTIIPHPQEIIRSPVEESIPSRPETSMIPLPNENITSLPEESIIALNEESIHSPPEESITSPPEEENITSPLEEESIKSPPEEDSIASPPEEENISSPLEEESIISPLVTSNEENITSPPEESITSPPEESITSPPEESITSPPEESITSPPDENVTYPAEDSITSPPDNSIASLPEENIIGPPEENIVSPPEENIMSPPEESITSPLDESISSPFEKFPKEESESVSSSFKFPADESKGNDRSQIDDCDSSALEKYAAEESLASPPTKYAMNKNGPSLSEIYDAEESRSSMPEKGADDKGFVADGQESMEVADVSSEIPEPMDTSSPNSKAKSNRKRKSEEVRAFPAESLEPAKKEAKKSTEPAKVTDNDDEEKPTFSPENIFEYQWPQEGKNSEYYVLQEQVSDFLGIKSFKRKYPKLTRRPTDPQERDFLKEKAGISEMMCDLGLTALKSEEVLELMCRDYPEHYKEYIKVLRERERERQRELVASNAETKMVDLVKKAIKSAAEYNLHLNQERKEERKSCVDLQTFTVHYPARKNKNAPVNTKPGKFPVALLPGQYQDFYKVYTANELKYLPLNTVLYGPLKELNNVIANSEGSQSDSDESSISDGSSSSDSSSGSDKNDEGGEPKSAEPAYQPKVKPDATCKVCRKGSEGKTEPEELVHCADCDNSAHPSCIELTADVVCVLRTYPWQCMDCKVCSHCANPDEEDKMLFCDICDRGYHTFCVGLKSLPQGKWVCHRCGSCASCGSSRPGPEGSRAQWQYEPPKDPKDRPKIMCQGCFKKKR